MNSLSVKSVGLVGCLLVALGGCRKSESQSATVSFTQPVYFLTKQDTLQVNAYLSSPAATAVAFPVAVGGSATRGTDYVLETAEFRFAAGEREARIRLIPKADVVEQHTVRLELQPTAGYSLGHHPVAFVPVETQDILTCSFEAQHYEINNLSSVRMVLYRGTSQYARPGADLYVPVAIDDASTAVLNVHYEIDRDTLAMRMSAAGQYAELPIRPLKVEAGHDQIVIRLAESARFRPGQYNKTTVTLKSRANE